MYTTAGSLQAEHFTTGLLDPFRTVGPEGGWSDISSARSAGDAGGGRIRWCGFRLGGRSRRQVLAAAPYPTWLWGLLELSGGICVLDNQRGGVEQSYHYEQDPGDQSPKEDRQQVVAIDGRGHEQVQRRGDSDNQKRDRR